MIKSPPAEAGDTGSIPCLWEDPTWHRASKPVLCFRAQKLELLKRAGLRARTRQEKSLREKPVHRNQRIIPTHTAREKPMHHQRPSTAKIKGKKKIKGEGDGRVPI